MLCFLHEHSLYYIEFVFRPNRYYCICALFSTAWNKKPCMASLHVSFPVTSLFLRFSSSYVGNYFVVKSGYYSLFWLTIKFSQINPLLEAMTLILRNCKKEIIDIKVHCKIWLIICQVVKICLYTFKIIFPNTNVYVIFLWDNDLRNNNWPSGYYCMLIQT